MAYFVYILHSNNGDHYYVGQSDNPQRRLLYHNSVEKGYTARYRPWELVYVKEFASRREAREVEGKIKRWKNKGKIVRLIERNIEL